MGRGKRRKPGKPLPDDWWGRLSIMCGERLGGQPSSKHVYAVTGISRRRFGDIKKEKEISETLLIRMANALDFVGTDELLDSLGKGEVQKDLPPIEASKSPNVPTTSHIRGNVTATAPVLYGREDVFAFFHQSLADGKRIVVLEGIGGVGKTAIADHIFTNYVKEKTNDTCIWINGMSLPKLDNASILDAIALHMDFTHIPGLDSAEKEQALFHILRKRNTLIVFDEFELVPKKKTDSIIRMFLRLPETCRFLLTTQVSLDAFSLIEEEISTKHIKGLESRYGLSLLKNECTRLELQGLVSESALQALNAALSGNPLGLKLVLRQIRTSVELSDVLTAAEYFKGKNLLPHIFNKSWLRLSSSAQSMLMTIPLFQGHFSASAVAAASGIGSNNIDSIEELIRCLLIESKYVQRYTSMRFDAHGLVREFAEDKLQESGMRNEYLKNIVRYYISYSDGADAQFWGGRETYKKFEEERHNLIFVMSWAYENDDEANFIQLVRNLTNYFIVSGDWQTCFRYGALGVAAAKKKVDTRSHAWLLTHNQAYLLVNTGKVDDAIVNLKHAIGIYQDVNVNDKEGQSHALRMLGRAYRKSKDMEKARMEYQSSLEVARSIDDKNLMSLVLNEIGKLERDCGSSFLAKTYLQNALDIIDESDMSIRAGILCNLSGVNCDLGLYDEALKQAAESFAYFSEVDNKEGIATSIYRQAQTRKSTKGDGAKELAEEAVSIFYRLGMLDECKRIRSEFDLSAEF